MNLHILQHSLGVDQYGQGERYRNHFATGPEGKDFPDCQALVKAGLMQDLGQNGISGTMHVFVVTEAGQEYVTANSPAPPIPPKLSKSKQRYQAYLKSETTESFGDWLKNPYWNEYRDRCLT